MGRIITDMDEVRGFFWRRLRSVMKEIVVLSIVWVVLLSDFLDPAFLPVAILSYINLNLVWACWKAEEMMIVRHIALMMRKHDISNFLMEKNWNSDANIDEIIKQIDREFDDQKRD